jgi:arginyl-tRNA synthetase
LLRRSREAEHEQIKAQLKGFKLNIDFEKLNYSDKLYAREMLQKAMARLEPNVED